MTQALRAHRGVQAVRISARLFGRQGRDEFDEVLRWLAARWSHFGLSRFDLVVSDAYLLFDQHDVTIRTVKDYIAEPKPNGYKSLHVIVDVGVSLSTGRVEIPVEVQFRTIAMDFWASLEHKIKYKFDGEVPGDLLGELKDAADTASALDTKMARLHRELHGPGTREL